MFSVSTHLAFMRAGILTLLFSLDMWPEHNSVNKHWGEMLTSSSAERERPQACHIFATPPTTRPSHQNLDTSWLQWIGKTKFCPTERHGDLRAELQTHNLAFIFLYTQDCDLWNLNLTHQSFQSNTSFATSEQFPGQVHVRIDFLEGVPHGLTFKRMEISNRWSSLHHWKPDSLFYYTDIWT